MMDSMFPKSRTYRVKKYHVCPRLRGGEITAARVSRTEAIHVFYIAGNRFMNREILHILLPYTRDLVSVTGPCYTSTRVLMCQTIQAISIQSVSPFRLPSETPAQTRFVALGVPVTSPFSLLWGIIFLLTTVLVWFFLFLLIIIASLWKSSFCLLFFFSLSLSLSLILVLSLLIVQARCILASSPGFFHNIYLAILILILISVPCPFSTGQAHQWYLALIRKRGIYLTIFEPFASPVWISIFSLFIPLLHFSDHFNSSAFFFFIFASFRPFLCYIFPNCYELIATTTLTIHLATYDCPFNKSPHVTIFARHISGTNFFLNQTP